MKTPQSEGTDPIQPDWNSFSVERDAVNFWNSDPQENVNHVKHVRFQSFRPGWNTFLPLAPRGDTGRRRKKNYGRSRTKLWPIQLFRWRSQRRLIVERVKTTSSLKRRRRQDSIEPLTESRTAGEVWRPPTNVTRLKVKTSKRFRSRLTHRWSNVERLWRTGLATVWMWGLGITRPRLLFLLKRTAALPVSSTLPANITTLAKCADRQN